MMHGVTRWGMTAAMMVVAAASRANSLQVWNPAQMGQQGDYSSNVGIGANTTIEGESAKVLTFNAKWAQIGKNYATPANWSAYEGGMMTLQNRSNFDVEMGFQFALGPNGTNATGISIKLRPGETTRFFTDTSEWQTGGDVQRMPYAVTESYYKHKFAGRPMALNTVHQWQIYYRGTQPAQVAVGEVRLFDRGNGLRKVDQFGQITDRAWPGKVSSLTQFSTDSADENADLSLNPGGSQLFGSTALPTTLGTGKWRVERTASGRAYFVTPSGKRFWAFGMTNVCANNPTLVSDRESEFQNLPITGMPEFQFFENQVVNGQNKRTFDFYRSNQYKKHGADWKFDFADLAARRMKSWNMNCLGSGSWVSEINDSAPTPFVMTLSTNAFPTRIASPVASWKSFPDAYDANFKTWIANNMGEAQWRSKGLYREQFLGLYIDGEMPWGERDGSMDRKYALPIAIMSKTHLQPAKVRFAGLLRTRYASNLAALNAAYGTTVPSWGSLTSSPFVVSTAALAKPQVQADMSFLLLNFASAYYSNVKAGLTLAQVSGLYLGSRDMLPWTPDEVWNAAKSSVDVISVNYYDESNLVPWQLFSSLKKPVLLSEFSFTGRDRNSTSGTSLNEGVEARDQVNRAAKAEEMLTTAVRNRNIIGAFWFRYNDQPVSGVAFNGENYQVGAVDITDKPYDGLVDVFRRFGDRLYTLRGGL